MVTALVLMNVERSAVNSTAQQLLTIPGVSEVYSVTGSMIWWRCCISPSMKIWPMSSPTA